MIKFIAEKKTKITALVLVVILALSAFTGIAVYSKGFTQWGDKDLSGIINGDNNENLESDKVHGLPQNIVATSANTAEVTFKATVKPADAFDKSLTWKVDWLDSTDEWTVGKSPTDYIQLTVNVKDSTEAAIKCIEAFGAVIILTATSVSNTDIKATAKIDYLKPFIGFNSIYFCGIQLLSTNESDMFFSPEDFSSWYHKEPIKSGHDLGISVSSKFGLGTVSQIAEELPVDFSFGFSDEYAIYTGFEGIKYTSNSVFDRCFYENMFGVSLTASTTAFEVFPLFFFDLQILENEGLYVLSNINKQFTLTINYTFTDGVKQSFNFNIGVDPAFIAYYMSDISEIILDKTQVII